MDGKKLPWKQFEITYDDFLREFLWIGTRILDLSVCMAILLGAAYATMTTAMMTTDTTTTDKSKCKSEHVPLLIINKSTLVRQIFHPLLQYANKTFLIFCLLVRYISAFFHPQPCQCKATLRHLWKSAIGYRSTVVEKKTGQRLEQRNFNREKTHCLKFIVSVDSFGVRFYYASRLLLFIFSFTVTYARCVH